MKIKLIGGKKRYKSFSVVRFKEFGIVPFKAPITLPL